MWSFWLVLLVGLLVQTNYAPSFLPPSGRLLVQTNYALEFAAFLLVQTNYAFLLVQTNYALVRLLVQTPSGADRLLVQTNYALVIAD